MSREDDDLGERARVYARIAPLIIAFKAERPDGAFHVEELREYVIERAPGIAPDSPGRILRELRLQRLVEPLKPPPPNPDLPLFTWR
jgi:hypothetical protein